MYKYHIIFLTAIALLRIGNTEAYAQKDLSHIAFFPAWGESWHFLSFPQILSLIVGNDGYIINIGQMASYGTTYFVPWGGEPEEIDSWIA